MRSIGDLDYLSKAKNTGGPEEEAAAPPEQPELTEKQKKWKKRKNWWYYNKWYVICGVILLGILLNIAGSRFGWWTKAPDFQIAYIGKAELPSDTVAALEQAFASIASDFNGDGEVIVWVNQYLYGIQSDDPDMFYYGYAKEISLIGDITDCVSYFFLMDDPEQFQRNYQLLACPDGSCPDELDYSVEDKVILWSGCPLLSGMDLGSYSVPVLGEEVSGSNQELLSGLSIGRRCFYAKDATDYADKCSELWALISQ